MDSKNFVPATRGIRLANHIIDHILSMFFCAVLALIIGFFSTRYFGGSIDDIGDVSVQFFVFLFIFRMYYIFFEGIWQSTPGKWITGTKVVRKDGRKPHFGQILGRSLVRIIPFEPLSYLTNPHPLGWHDRLSRTLVVSSNATKEDVQSIDYQAIKKNTSNKLLYIVLSIFVGIMLLQIIFTIIIVSVDKARVKAHDKNIMSTVSLMHDKAQEWNPMEYQGVFPQDPSTEYVEGDEFGSLFTDDHLEDNSLYFLIDDLPNHAPYFYASDAMLPRDGGKWFFAIRLSNGFVCTDYTGAIKTVIPDPGYPNWEDVYPNTVSAYSCN